MCSRRSSWIRPSLWHHYLLSPSNGRIPSAYSPEIMRGRQLSKKSGRHPWELTTAAGGGRALRQSLRRFRSGVRTKPLSRGANYPGTAVNKPCAKAAGDKTGSCASARTIRRSTRAQSPNDSRERNNRKKGDEGQAFQPISFDNDASPHGRMGGRKRHSGSRSATSKLIS